MKKLKIEWRHLEASGETCLRCSETGKTLYQLIDELKEELAEKGIELVFAETKLTSEEISQSNSILINNRPLEDWLSGARVSESICPSCCELIGDEVYCRTIEYEGKAYESVPEEIIRQTIYKTLDLKEEKEWDRW